MNSPGVMSDRPVRTNQRASPTGKTKKKKNRADTNGTANEYSGAARWQDPDESLALFNRSVAEEKLAPLHAATDDWNHYLRIVRRALGF